MSHFKDNIVDILKENGSQLILISKSTSSRVRTGTKAEFHEFEKNVEHIKPKAAKVYLVIII